MSTTIYLVQVLGQMARHDSLDAARGDTELLIRQTWNEHAFAWHGPIEHEKGLRTWTAWVTGFSGTSPVVGTVIEVTCDD